MAPEGNPKGDPKGDSKGDPKRDPKGDPKGNPNEDSKGDPKAITKGDPKGSYFFKKTCIFLAFVFWKQIQNCVSPRSADLEAAYLKALLYYVRLLGFLLWPPKTQQQGAVREVPIFPGQIFQGSLSQNIFFK